MYVPILPVPEDDLKCLNRFQINPRWTAKLEANVKRKYDNVLCIWIRGSAERSVFHRNYSRTSPKQRIKHLVNERPWYYDSDAYE